MRLVAKWGSGLDALSRLMALSVLIATLVGVSGCATFGMEGAQHSEAKDREALLARAQQRADAIVALDIPTVYEFATPSYRKVYDVAHLENQYAAQIQRLKAEAVEVYFQSDARDTAKVHVKMRYRSYSVGPEPFEDTTEWLEPWVKENGKWWYVEPR